MKIEKVTQNKIKITLTSDDMDMWDLDIEKISTNAPQARDFFINIIERAESELSFNIKDSQLLVEAVMKTDGSVIHISKINPDSDDINRLTRARIKKIEVRVRRKSSNENKCVVYIFDKFDDAVDACKLITAHFDGYSDFYKYNNKFYLVMYYSDSADKHIAIIMSEYGTKVDKYNSLIGMLNEHGELMIKEHAVKTLSAL